MNTFEEHLEVKSLRQDFEELKKSHLDVLLDCPRIATGADRIDLFSFERQIDKHLRAINRKVLQKRYTFSPFLERKIPKDGSSELRIISLSTIRDTLVQRALYKSLQSQINDRLIDNVYAYRPGYNAHQAVLQAYNYRRLKLDYVFDADLSKFFDSVDHDLLLFQLEALNLPCTVTTLLRRFLKAGRISSDQTEEHKTRKGQQRKYEVKQRVLGLPQGGVLSGMLANLYLAGFDRMVSEYHAGYIRYADDFIVCCRSKNECAEVTELVTEKLEKLKLSLNRAKTNECILPSKGVEFLGFKITSESIRVRSANIHKFKDRISQVISSQKRRRHRRDTLQALCDRLAFKIRGPTQDQMGRLVTHGLAQHPYRRNWIGFFRIINDENQVRLLDNWIRRRVSAYMWKAHRKSIKFEQMKACGLPTLLNYLYRARCPMKSNSTHSSVSGAHGESSVEPDQST